MLVSFCKLSYILFYQSLQRRLLCVCRFLSIVIFSVMWLSIYWTIFRFASFYEASYFCFIIFRKLDYPLFYQFLQIISTSVFLHSKKRYIYKSKNANKNMPKNTTKYLVILKECKNIYYIFVDNMKRRIYNKNSYGRDEL